MRFLWMIVILLFLTHYINAEGRDLKVLENNHFEIVGEDMVSLNYLDDLSTIVSKSVYEHLYFDNHNYNKKILVQLISKEGINPYFVDQSNLGFVTLNLYWTENLDLHHTIEGLVASVLKSYFYSVFGLNNYGIINSKNWAVKALVYDVYAKINPLYINHLLRKNKDLLNLEQLINNDYLDIYNDSSISYYRFFLYLKSLDINYLDKASLLRGSLMGNNIEIINDKIIKDKSLLIDNLESGFLEFNKELINSLDFNFLNLRDSKLLIEELILFKMDDLSLKNLYSAKGIPDLIDLLNARIEIIILSANRINPIYFNSISALAQYFQKIIAQDSKDQMQVSLDIFFDEFDAATEIHELIELNL